MLRLWRAAKGDCANYLTVARRPMLSVQKGRDGHIQVVDKLKSGDGIPKATMEIHVTSSQEMEETGAFFGVDSRGGDVVLLWG